MSRRSKRRSKVRKKVVDCAKNVVGVPVTHKLTGPNDAGVGRWPNAKERAFVWRGKPPPVDEAARIATYDLNIKLANDLRRNVTIVKGSRYIRSSSECLFVGKRKKRN